MPPSSFPSSGLTLDQTRFICAVFRGELVSWMFGDEDATQDYFLRAMRRHYLLPLIHDTLQNSGGYEKWPLRLQIALRAESRRQAVFDGVQSAEIAAVLGEASELGIHPLLLKGTPLAHTLYPFPHLRPRVDVDLFVSHKDFANFAKMLLKRGYERRNAISGSQISRQADFIKPPISLDVHWKISNSPLFDALPSYDEATARRQPVVSLGRHAFTLAASDALLLACAHLALNLQMEFRLIWIYDIHLLVERLTEFELNDVFRQAKEKKLYRIIHFSLTLAQFWFGTRLPDGFPKRAADAAEPETSALLLNANLTAAHRYAIEVGHLSVRDRLTFLKEMTLPSAEYILKRYEKKRRAWLPLLYIHRGLRGLKRLLAT